MDATKGIPPHNSAEGTAMIIVFDRLPAATTAHKNSFPSSK